MNVLPARYNLSTSLHIVKLQFLTMFQLWLDVNKSYTPLKKKIPEGLLQPVLILLMKLRPGDTPCRMCPLELVLMT